MAVVTEVKAVWSGFTGAPGTSTFYVGNPASLTVPIAPAALTSAVAAFRQFFNAMASQLAASVVISFDGSAKDLDTATGVLVSGNSYTPPSSVAGTGSSSVAAPAGASVRWRTASVYGGRLLTGRTFLVPLYAGAYEANGSLNATFLTQAQTASGVLTAASIASGTWRFIIWHRPQNGAGGATGDVASSTWKDEVAILRSRRD
jgi:hypothetical protein